MAGLLEDQRWAGKIYLDGWRDGSAGTREVREPATDKALGRVGLATPGDVAKAGEIAQRAQREWAAVSVAERAAVLRRAGDLWSQHADEVVDWLVRESGSVPAKARSEARTAAQECYEAAALPTRPIGEIPATDGTGWSMARRRPAGVVGVISPFDFPLILSIRSVAPALALGNSVLLKPDPRTAVSGGVTLMRVFEEAGLPRGALQLLTGGADVGEAMVTARHVRVVSFAGTARAGRRVGELGARHLKRVRLELAGDNTLIVLPGADLALAASAGAFGSFLHQRQVCMTTGRHLVHESLYEEYLSRLAEKAANLPVGDPASEQVALGPLIDERQRDRVHEVVQDSVSAGAELLTGGQYTGLFYRPTVLADVTDGHRVWCEEVFGPVAPVRMFRDEDEAIEMARDTEYGLSLAILGDVATAMRLADEVPAGLVHINEQPVADGPHVRFGGTYTSGNGARFAGASADVAAFTEHQWLTAHHEIRAYPS